ncbi:hypothetical protein OG215_38675 (plasmid) [Streptomyces globisporus]|uniref:hypothetical protein n=1 Tax=Streptomyces globisporus TaxID=1908 RepID=UPI002F90DE97|nr:hypothetical protein OG215_38675 [Streptomyces globisporus]
MPMTDHELAQAINAHTFEEREGRPALPLQSHPLGQRLYHSLVRGNGSVNSALGADAQAALQAKGFALAQSRDGRKTGLHPDTPRTGGTSLPALTDDQLAQAIAGHTFEEREGRPILPPQSHPLGMRLYSALVKENGTVLSALEAGAQAALQAKGFTLAQSGDGRRTGLHPETPRAGGRHQPTLADDQLAQAIAGHTFEEREGRPILPPSSHPLGLRLYSALVKENGSVLSALEAGAQAALQAKGFALAQSRDGRKTGLHPDTPRTGGRHQPTLADNQLAQAIAAHTFEEREGRPILPPQSHPLGVRLYCALVKENGSVQSALEAGAQAALRAKGFALAQSGDGRRTGLHPDTPRTGGTHQPSLADDQLAQAIAAHTFEEREGRPVLPLQSHPLGQRLINALVRENGGVNSALGAEAQAALQAKGFALAQSRDGRKTGLHPHTPRAGGRHRRWRDTGGQAHAVVPGPGAQDYPTNAPAGPGRDPRDLRAAAAATRAPGGPGGPVPAYTGTSLPRVDVLDMPLPRLAALAKQTPTPPNLPGTPTPGTLAARYHQPPHTPQPTRTR